MQEELTLTAEGAVAGQLSPKARTRTKPIGGMRVTDPYLWGVYIALIVVSVVELFSASSREVSSEGVFGVLSPVVRHGTLLLMGFGIIWFFKGRHYRLFIPFTYLFVLLSVGMMLYVLANGEIVNGARRSMSILGFQIQPAEFIKMSAVLVVSLIMARSQKSKEVGVTDRGMWIAAGFVLFFSALLARQGLTNTMLLMAVSLSMMLVGGVKIKKMMMVLGIYAIFGGGFYLYLSQSSDGAADNRSSTWTARIDRKFSSGDAPLYEQKIDSKNRQEMYSYMAQANGGVTGVLPGNGREAARLPLAFSDFIFAIVIEDWGLIGGALLLLIYLCLLGRASGLASRCSRAYPALLVIGMAVLIVLQALVHMIIVTGLGPVSGQPLPLISKGGSSIIITSMAFGIMLSVSRFATRTGAKKTIVNEEKDLLPEDVRAENPTLLK